VTVTTYDPGAAVVLAVSVRVDVVPVTGLGLKPAVTPAGSPVTLSWIEPVKPLSLEIVIVLVPEPPWGTVSVEGEAEIVKSGGAEAVTVSV
jgi:hypothetical protein